MAIWSVKRDNNIDFGLEHTQNKLWSVKRDNNIDFALKRTQNKLNDSILDMSIGKNAIWYHLH